jgi:S-adenosylmethionine decarboxylase
VLDYDHTRSNKLPIQNLENRCMHLYAMDVWVRQAQVLTDARRLKSVLHRAADAGGATVVGEKFYVFPNGAVTGVLVLAQSHLSIHTWPEFGLANIDLLSYGVLRGGDVLRAIGKQLDADHVKLTCIPRSIV